MTQPHASLCFLQSISIILSFGVLGGMSGCQSTPPPPRIPQVISPETRPQNDIWELSWSDEFNETEGTPINPEKWVHDLGGHGWGNAQLEDNTDQIDNVSHTGDGHLAITARAEQRIGNEYSSGRIKSQDRFEFQYGRVEARIKLPTGQGIWPAFWMLGNTIDQEGWPECGEIDIMEHRGQRPKESTGAIHGKGFSAGEAIGGRYLAKTPLHEDFHLFALEWSPTQLRWFVDEDLFLEVSPDQLPKGSSWPFRRPFFLLLNVAVGGHYVGNPDSTTRFPQRMLVDYVRVYQSLNSTEGELD